MWLKIRKKLRNEILHYIRPQNPKRCNTRQLRYEEYTLIRLKVDLQPVILSLVCEKIEIRMAQRNDWTDRCWLILLVSVMTTCRLRNEKSLKKRMINHVFIMILSKNTFLNGITSCSFHLICIKKRQTEQSEAVGVLMRGWTYGLLTHRKARNADLAVSTQKYMQKRAGWFLCWDWHQYKWGLLKKNSNPAFSSEGGEELSVARKLRQDRDVMTQVL